MAYPPCDLWLVNFRASAFNGDHRSHFEAHGLFLMLLALAYNSGDYDAAMDWLRWCIELDGHWSHDAILLIASSQLSQDHILAVHAQAKVLCENVTSIRANGDDRGPWPMGPNAMFKACNEWIRLNPQAFIWIEPDAIPLTPNWFGQIQAEYASCGKPFMGCKYDQPWPHLNGVAMYPANIARYNPAMLGATKIPFDCVDAQATLSRAHNTPLIRRLLADPSRNQPLTFPTQESLKQIPEGCVLFHGCKDGSLIARLREKRAPQVPLKPRYSFPWNKPKTVGTLIHVFTDYTPRDPDTIRRNALAQSTWLAQRWTECPVKDEDLPRLWKEKGRRFPYIKDVFDVACARAQSKNDIIIYTNADICLSTDCEKQIAQAMVHADGVYCYRRDFPKLTSPLADTAIRTGHDYCGSDLKAFRVSWWKANRKKFPDMVLGMELWDPCMRLLIDRTNPPGKTCLKNLIYHERHGSYWEKPENRYTLDAQKHCLRIGSAYLRSINEDPAHYGVPPWYGLKCDIAVLGLAHETVMLPKVILNLKETLKAFDWKAFVCGSPPTQRILSQLVADKRFQVVHEPALKSTRYARMAQLRNTVLRAYRDSGLEPKAILWLDMDVLGFHKDAGEAIAKLLKRDDWDVMAAFGLRSVATCRNDTDTPRIPINGKDYVYYDWLAYESTDSERVLWCSNGDHHWYSHGKVPADIRFSRRPLANVQGHVVHSAFGPACFYRSEAIEGLWYNEQTEQCEHQEFHAAMRARQNNRIFISDDIVALYD